jgi:hypothetical protein
MCFENKSNYIKLACKCGEVKLEILYQNDPLYAQFISATNYLTNIETDYTVEYLPRTIVELRHRKIEYGITIPTEGLTCWIKLTK